MSKKADKKDSKKVYYQKSKTQKPSGRENFLKLYNRTGDRIYFYAYDLCGNLTDADMIFRDSFIFMHEHIAELRSSKSLDSWQKECVEKAFRALLRSQLLSLVKDASPSYSASSSLSETHREELWNKIIKMADIDPWRMVPIPGKSTIFSVLADQTISDLRYMSLFDILKSVVLVVVIVAAFFAAIIFGVKYISEKTSVQIEESQEVFLDERYYADYVLSVSTALSKKDLEDAYNVALRYDVDEEGNSLKYTAPASIGNTAGTPTYTEDPDINAKLIDIVDSVINDEMSDYEKLLAIYVYVGGSMEYREYPSENGSDRLGLLKDYFELHAGNSLHYAAILDALCDAAGYDCEVVSGAFILNRDTEFERTVEHYWNRLWLNGIVYYMDIEADCDESGTTVREYYFKAADGTSKWAIFERDHEWN